MNNAGKHFLRSPRIMNYFRARFCIQKLQLKKDHNCWAVCLHYSLLCVIVARQHFKIEIVFWPNSIKHAIDFIAGLPFS